MNDGVCSDRRKKLFCEIWDAAEYAAATTEEIEIKREYELDYIARSKCDIADDYLAWLRPIFETFLANRQRQLNQAMYHLVARGCA